MSFQTVSWGNYNFESPSVYGDSWIFLRIMESLSWSFSSVVVTFIANKYIPFPWNRFLNISTEYIAIPIFTLGISNDLYNV